MLSVQMAVRTDAPLCRLSIIGFRKTSPRLHENGIMRVLLFVIPNPQPMTPHRLSLRERREIERLRRPEPEHMISVVFQTVARIGVREDGKALPVLDEPGDDLAKQFRSEGELATSPRVRTDRGLSCMRPPARPNVFTNASHSSRACSRLAASK